MLIIIIIIILDILNETDVMMKWTNRGMDTSQKPNGLNYLQTFVEPFMWKYIKMIKNILKFDIPIMDKCTTKTKQNILIKSQNLLNILGNYQS